MSAIMERWIGGCRRELLDRTLVWNPPHLRRILRQYEAHHNTHRAHMALAGAASDKSPPVLVDNPAIGVDLRVRERHDRRSCSSR